MINLVLNAFDKHNQEQWVEWMLISYYLYC